MDGRRCCYMPARTLQMRSWISNMCTECGSTIITGKLPEKRDHSQGSQDFNSCLLLAVTAVGPSFFEVCSIVQMVKPLTKRICLLCGRRGDSRVLCFTRTKYRNTVVLLSSLVLFNEMDLEEAKRCYDLGKRRGICDSHYIDAARLITSELACLGIAIASYVAQPSGELVSYVDEKDLPLHLVDSIQAIARKMDENLDINMRKIRDFLNTCLYRYGTDFLHPTTSVADSQLEYASTASKPEADKRTALLCGTSTTPGFVRAVPNHSVKEECDGYVIEEVEETDPDILEKTFPVRGDRLLSLFRFCPKCGTQITRKRRRLVLSEKGPSPVVQYICNTCGGKRCWYAI